MHAKQLYMQRVVAFGAVQWGVNLRNEKKGVERREGGEEISKSHIWAGGKSRSIFFRALCFVFGVVLSCLNELLTPSGQIKLIV